MIINKEKYISRKKNGEIGYPGVDMTHAGDDHTIYLNWAEYIWSQYIAGTTLIDCDGSIYSSQSRRSVGELRAYAQDRQPVDKYQKRLDPSLKDDHARTLDQQGRKGMMNISWDPPKVMSKFVEIVRGKFDELRFDLKTVAIDASANRARELRVAKKKVLARPEMKEMVGAIGFAPSDNINMEGIESPSDVDILEKLGGERLAYEIAMNAAVKATMDISEWKDATKIEIQDDLIILGILAARATIDPYTNRVKAHRIDPENLICPASRKMDFSDLTWAGERRVMSLHQLRAESGLDEKTLYLIAKEYLKVNASGMSKQNLNSFTSRNVRENFYQVHGRQIYDDFTIEVLDYYFIGNKTEKYVVGNHHRTGAKIYDRVDINAELSERDRVRRKKSFETKAVNYVYKGSWIPGTSFLFNCGVDDTIVRAGSPGNKIAQLPIFVFATGMPSIVEKCVAAIDDICLSVYKKRDALAKMIPAPGIAIDLAKVEPFIKIGGNKYTIAQLLGMASSSGLFIYQSIPEYPGSNQNGSGRSPIEPLRDRVVEILQVLHTEIQTSVNDIRQATGINEIADGSATGEMLVGVVKGLDAATNTVLRPIFRTYSIMNKKFSMYWVRKWQSALISGEINIEHTTSGDTLKALTLTPDLRDHDFGVTLEILPTEQDKQMLLSFLIEKRQQGVLRVDDFFNLERMVNNDQIAMAQLYAAKAIDAQEATIRKQQMENIQMQSQANAQAAQAAEQAKVKSAKMISNIKVEEEIAMIEPKKALMQFEATLKAQQNAMTLAAQGASE